MGHIFIVIWYVVSPLASTSKINPKSVHLYCLVLPCLSKPPSYLELTLTMNLKNGLLIVALVLLLSILDTATSDLYKSSHITSLLKTLQCIPITLSYGFIACFLPTFPHTSDYMAFNISARWCLSFVAFVFSLGNHSQIFPRLVPSNILGTPI